MKVYKCFLCEKWGMVENPLCTDYESRREDRKVLLRLYGYVKILAGKIGDKWICNDCRDDLQKVIHPRIWP